MTHVYVHKGIEFKKDLIWNEAEWYKSLGEELEKKHIKLTIAPGIDLSNAADCTAFYTRVQTDAVKLATDIGLPAGVTIQQYVADLKETADDVVKDTSDVHDVTFEVGPTSEIAKLLGLD